MMLWVLKNQTDQNYTLWEALLAHITLLDSSLFLYHVEWIQSDLLQRVLALLKSVGNYYLI